MRHIGVPGKNLAGLRTAIGRQAIEDTVGVAPHRGKGSVTVKDRPAEMP